MMDITVLGSCGSAPTKERNLPGVAVQIGGNVLLLDCGEGSQRQMMSFGVSYAKVRAIFVSHLHLDHFLGIFGLGETLRLSGVVQKIDIFGPVGLERFLYSFGHRDIFAVHEICAKDCSLEKPIFSISNHDVFCFEVEHGKKMNAFGYLIKERERLRFYEKKAKSLGILGPMFTQIQKEGHVLAKGKKILLKDVTYAQKGLSLAYSGDTLYSKNLVSNCKGVNLLIHECTFDSERAQLAAEKFHSTAVDAAKAAKGCGAKSLVLTHLGGKYSKESKPLLTQAKKIFKNSIIASDGLKINLK
ncbi:MAG: ribonuclease Z [Candidatus Micrarchaeia archaeon]